jgi:hypothetical protein
MVRLNRVQVSALRFHGHVGEILRPVSKRASFIEVGAMDRGGTIGRTLKPVELHEFRRQPPARNRCLDAEEQLIAVSLGHDLDPALRRFGEYVRQSRLRARMEVKLRLLDIHELTCVGGVKCHD